MVIRQEVQRLKYKLPCRADVEGAKVRGTCIRQLRLREGEARLCVNESSIKSTYLEVVHESDGSSVSDKKVDSPSASPSLAVASASEGSSSLMRSKMLD